MRLAADLSIPDVALDSANSLHGEVRDEQGQPQVDTDVLLWQEAAAVKRTRTDRQGHFVFPHLTGGAYRILTPTASTACRAWTLQAAPPQARRRLLLVSDAGLARGQQPMNEMFIFNPLVMASVIAAAIAIPIAIHNSNNDDRPPGS
jgi:hypothetical protein